MKKFVNLSSLDLSLKSQEHESTSLGKYLNGVDCKNGKITNSIFVESLYSKISSTNAELVQNQIQSVVGEIASVYSYQAYIDGTLYDYLIFCSADYKIYYLNINAENLTVQKLLNVNLTSMPKIDFFIMNGKNLLLISTATDDLWVWDGITMPYDVLNAPKINGLAVGLNRLFVATQDKPYSVLFSEDLDPTSWGTLSEDIEEITFSDDLGKVLNVFALQNYIFVLRERGIVKIYGNSGTNFSTSKVFTSSGKIYSNSVCMCGDNVVYLASDGLYSFDGVNSKKIYTQLDGLFKNLNTSMAVSQDNKIYLLTNMYQADNVSDCLVILDLATSKVTNVTVSKNFKSIFKIELNGLRGVCLLYSTQENAKIPYILCKNGHLISENAEFGYISQDIMLSPEAQNKVLCSIELLSKFPVNLSVFAGNNTKNIAVSGKKYYQKFLLNMPCKNFSIAFAGNGKVDISDIKLTYNYLEN